MFMKTRSLIIDRQIKKLMINRKKQNTEQSSKKPNIQNKKGVQSNRRLTTDKKLKLKRKLASISRKVISGRTRKKRKMEKVDKVDEPIDRISELPEPLIHHILSLMNCPRDVARVTTLSKKWRSIWASFFFFDFDQKRFKTSGEDHIAKFITFVETSLSTKFDQMDTIHKFKISLSDLNLKLSIHTHLWVQSAMDKKLKELEIHIDLKKKNNFVLPYINPTLNTLTSLRLSGCRFTSESVLNLHNLKQLSIKNTQVNPNVIQGLINGCPFVEDLRLVSCTGIGSLHISTMVKLTRVELHECHGLVDVKIELLSLLSFMYIGKKSWNCEISLVGCENLKYLTLKDLNLTDVGFQDFVTSFSNLEKIALRDCDNLERVTILSKRIRELSLIHCKKIGEAIIDAPNLSVFEYSGDKIPFSSMNIEGLREVKLHFHKSKRELTIFKELLMFLSKFKENGVWKMIVSSNKNVTIQENVGRVGNLSSHDLKLELIKSPLKLKGYVSNLLRMSRPKTLSLVSSSSSEFLKFVMEKIMLRETNPKCCTYYTKKCWLHHIEDVKMVVFEGSESGGRGKGKGKGTSQNLQQTTFTFIWKS